MIPYEDHRKLKPKQSGSQVVAGSSHPLKSTAPKSYNRAANIYERREQESLNNSRPVQPKPPSTATRQHGSADAAERWSKDANSKKPASKLGGMSADAAERWSNKPKKPASKLGGMSADAAERWGKGASSKPQLAIASSKKVPETKNVPLSFNKATQIQRQEERNFTNSRSLHPVTKLETSPKPVPGSASDLTAARKALQETLKANREFEAKPGIPKQGRLGEMEQKDIRQEVGRAKARLESSTKAKALQDFKADPSIPKNGRVRDMEIKDLQQEVSSANARYMGSQGRDRQGQPIKLTPVEPPKPEPKKSWWDRTRDSVTEKASDAWDKTKLAGNFVKDHSADFGHGALDIVGFVPIVGDAADLANAGWYLAEGDKVNAALSAASAIPFVGDAAKIGKYGAKVAQYTSKIEKAAPTIRRVTDGASAVVDVGNSARYAVEGDWTNAGLSLASAGVGGAVTAKSLDGSAFNRSNSLPRRAEKDGVFYAPESLTVSRNRQHSIRYNNTAPGAKEGFAPAIRFVNSNPRGKPVIKFDGIEVRKVKWYGARQSHIIDRKTNITTGSKQIKDLNRMSEALRQNPRLKGVIQMPDDQKVKKAKTILENQGINNIQVETAPL